MPINTNASSAKNGFNYQDVVAVALLIKNIKEIDSMIDEGKNGDIELLFSDNKTIYLQCKSRMNTIDTKNYTIHLKKALRDLINSYNKDFKPDKIIYVTNSNYPFGTNKDFDFTTPYKIYNYKHFDKDIKDKINKQVGNIRKDFDNNRDKKLSEYTKQLSSDNLNKILNNLSVMKFAFDGEDYESKLQLAYKYVQKFLTKIHINGNVNNETVFNNLYTRISIGTGMYTGNKKKIVKKESVVSELLFSFLESDNTIYEKFIANCQIGFDEENFIKKEVNDLKDLFINDFHLQQKINTEYNNYSTTQKNTSNSYEILGNFINDNILDLSRQFNMTEKSKQDVVKYMVWIMVYNKQRINELRDVCNYEN